MRFWKRTPSNLEVLERLESLERRFKTLLTDVDEYFHLVRRAENRIKEKSAKIEALQLPQEGNGTEPVGSPFSSTTYTARQKEIQQAVLRRRGGGTPT